MTFPEIRVTSKGAARFRSGHPWIFASDVSDHGQAAGGAAVRVLDPAGRPLGVAHYSSHSQIALRWLSQECKAVDRSFFLQRLRQAQEFRNQVVRGTEAFRLVYGEADLLPGLVVDRYGTALAVQALTQGMDQALPVILDCLEELCSPSAIVLRNDSAVRAKEGLALEARLAAGSLAGPVRFQMNGLLLAADLLAGQKTGVFLDQRENYLAAARWARGKALDCFTSTGGFALHIARACHSVEAVDSAASAVTLAAENARANGVANVHWVEANAFDVLSRHSAAGRRFDIIILDPPAFTKSRATIDTALRGYKEINFRALRMLEAGGRLITCSCSHHVSEAALLEVVAQAALDAHRTLRVLERRTQSEDHPILLTVPETHYLKCLILECL